MGNSLDCGPCFGFLGGDKNTGTEILKPPPKQNPWRIGDTHKIVVGIGAKDYEGSEECLRFAISLSNSMDEVVAMHVASGDTTVMQDRMNLLEKTYKKECETKGVLFETEVIQGNPKQQLLQASLGSDMLMVGGGHKGYGTVARFSCEYSRVNMTVVKRGYKESGPIIVGIGCNDFYGSLSALKLAFDLANDADTIIALYVPVSQDVCRGEWRRKSMAKEVEEGAKVSGVIQQVRERADVLIETAKSKDKRIKFKLENKEGHFDRMNVRTELMEAGKNARMMILGSGRKGFGSVARYVVENSPNCPIVLAKYVRAESQTQTETDV